jgi:hypothetical protein
MSHYYCALSLRRYSLQTMTTSIWTCAVFLDAAQRLPCGLSQPLIYSVCIASVLYRATVSSSLSNIALAGLITIIMPSISGMSSMLHVHVADAINMDVELEATRHIERTCALHGSTGVPTTHGTMPQASVASTTLARSAHHADTRQGNCKVKDNKSYSSAESSEDQSVTLCMPTEYLNGSGVGVNPAPPL